MRREDIHRIATKVFEGVVVLSVVGIVLSIVVWAANHDVKVCKARGGEIHSRTIPGISMNGQIAFSVESLCLSPDGRILGD